VLCALLESAVNAITKSKRARKLRQSSKSRPPADHVDRNNQTESIPTGQADAATQTAGDRLRRTVSRYLIQVVYFNQSSSSGVAYTAQDRCVIARLQISDNRRLACRSRSVAAVLNIADLIAGDNAAEYGGLPVIIDSDQCSGPVV
jgi:hypothetical protein